MMALNANDRYQTPQEVMRALLPFLEPRSQGALDNEQFGVLTPESPVSTNRVLIIDDEAEVRGFASVVLAEEGIGCDEAANGVVGLKALREKKYDLVLLDVDMPKMSGLEVLARLRDSRPSPHLKVIMMSGRVTGDQMAELLLAGANDYLSKPFSLVQFRSRVQAALELKEAQDRTDALNRKLLAIAAEQEQSLRARDSDLVDARNALVLALARLVEQRTSETGTHLLRLQRYCQCLAVEAALVPEYASQIDENFVKMLQCSAPLYDIGKVGLPDYILQKPGKLTADERILMQTHTTIGAETLAQVVQQHGFAQPFLHMAVAIARHHHERWDGTGYPDRLSGQDIPLAARMVSLAEVYDALRCRRSYKPALSHLAAVQLMTDSVGQFDPGLLAVFQRCAGRMEQFFREMAG
jgi:response regulator RpfG family c-di-GMP phosphodiesterase